MADINVNNLNDSAENIREVFAEISNLVDELNKNLASTVKLTQDVNNNLAQSNDKTKESTKQEASKEDILKRVGSLKRSELKALEEGLKTGKGFTKELAAKLKLEGKSGALAGTAAMMKARALGLTKKAIEEEKKRVKQQLKSNTLTSLKNEALLLGNRIVDTFLVSMMAADKEVNNMSKGLNISYGEALKLKQEFAKAASNSGDIAVNSIRMSKAMGTLNSQLGSAFRFTDEMLMTTSKLTDVVGLSAEAAGSLAFQSQRSGESLRSVEENVLGASYELQQGAGIALDMKGILEATGKVTGQLRAQLGGNPKLIAKAVTAAKLLGAEISDIVNSSKSLLNFEQSIESELEAELLTGKQLNLERARAAALAGDQETVAKELAANMGTFTDFTKMNTLQQDALAKAMGMSSDQLSDMLFKQETMGMNAKQLRAQGKDELADRLEQLDAQEKMTLAQEKMTSIMGDLATVFLPVVEGFGNLVGLIMESKVALGAVVTIMASLAVASVISAIANIYRSFAELPFGIGVPIAIGAAAGLLATIATAKSASSVKMAEGGIVKPRPGGTLATIGEAGQPEAVVPLNKAKQMGFGGGGSAQPIIIQNNWDAFAASNGNGRRGLGGTQEMQVSPTFA